MKIILIAILIFTIVPILKGETVSIYDSNFQYDLIVSTNGNITSIQQAIDIAEDNNVILIMNGTYNENIVIDKPLRLIGENKTNTIIDGRETGNTIKINEKNVTIQGLTIRHSGLVFPNSGINLSSSYATIANNIIINNLYGMTLYNADYNSIRNNLIQNNVHCGIYMSHSSDNTLFLNMINNHTFNGFGIYDDSNNNVIKNNIFSSNNYCGINLRISSDNIIIGNTFTDNNIGIHVPFEENTIENNTFSNNKVKFDKEIVTPGFEIFLMVISLVFLIVYVGFFRKVK